jgi:regulator of telomere elongation helicase 1
LKIYFPNNRPYP